MTPKKAFLNMSKHPLQPIELDKNGTPRFKPNKVVQFLLDNGGLDLNLLAVAGLPDEDHEQFAQLIGYSVSGFGSLSYVSDGTARVADELADRLVKGAPAPVPIADAYRQGFEDGKAAGIDLVKQVIEDIDR